MRKIKPPENDLVPFLLFLLNCVQLFVVHSLSQVWLFATPWTAARQASLVPHYLPELAQTHVLKSCLQPFPASGSFLMSWLFTLGSQIIGTSVLAISLSNEYSGLISFRIDWLDLLAVQGTLNSLLQHDSWKASMLPCSAIIIVQISHPYMTTRKTIALTRQTFVGKVTSLLFHTLSRFVIDFLPRINHLLIPWLQSPSAVILKPKKIACHCFYIFPSVCQEVIGPDAMILVFEFWVLRQF